MGASKESLAKDAEDAVAEASKTARGIKWARVAELEMELGGKKIIKYRPQQRFILTLKAKPEHDCRVDNSPSRGR